jgi:UDP-3-O-[3-hydroxymyristoyl] N-acetylglucosamine deacetylase
VLSAGGITGAENGYSPPLMTARRTLAREISAEGTALHAGAAVRMTLAPAAAGFGVVFRRADLHNAEVPARYDLVSETNLGTIIATASAKIGVIEHLMAAVAGAGIDDLLVILDGPEPPILDGDALSYLSLIEAAGIREQSQPRRAIEVLRRVEVSAKDAHAALLPAPGLAYEMEIDFASAAIGRQSYAFAFSPEGFRRDIAPARTFGFLHELEALNKMGLGRGASLENTLAVDGDKLVNAPLLRFPDEFVRHKILDAIGDMALAGAPLIGRFVGARSGHALNNALLRALFADSANYRLVSVS